MANPSTLELDYSLIGRNLRRFRNLRGKSQAEIAELAGISIRTLFRIENGSIVRLGTLNRICDALGCDLAEISTSQRLIQSKKTDELYLLHPREKTVWYADGDLRRMKPSDSQTLIQNEAERHRLGSLGFVSMFVTSPSFTLTYGPGVALFELYGKHSTTYPFLYRDLLFVCLRGEVLFTIESEVVRVRAGEAITPGPYSVSYEPATPVGPHDLAPLLLHIGGERVTPFAPPS